MPLQIRRHFTRKDILIYFKRGCSTLENALIISHSEKSVAFFTEMLNEAFVHKISVLRSCAEARRLLLEYDFDLVIINAPLMDETGESLSRHIASKGISQVILAVESEYFDAVAAACENDGVLTIEKPIAKPMFWSALTLAKSAQSRYKRLHSENKQLKQRIENIRIVDRAKSILISCMNMTEQEAHRHIEKRAMDLRSAKKAIAEEIIKTYENS